MSNIKEFLKETIAQAKKEEEKAFSEGRQIILGAYENIIKESPVDTAYFRLNNLLTVNKTTSQTVLNEDEVVKQKDYYRSVAESAEAENKNNILKLNMKTAKTITIQNNVDYADEIEAGRSKKQAPRGVYGITEDKIQQILNKDIKI